MPDKSFEHSILFERVNADGDTIWVPVVEVTLINASGERYDLPLLFDTGASVTTLRRELYPLLGVPSWDVGDPQDVGTAGGEDPVTMYQYDDASLELFGTRVDCTIQLAPLGQNPLYVGLLGRNGVYDAFGFGFWESDHTLFVTEAP